MHHPKIQKMTGLALAALITCQAIGQPAAPAAMPGPAAPATVASSADAGNQPKFIWGVLVNMALRFALSIFTDYVQTKVSREVTPPVFAALLKTSGEVPVVSLSSLGLEMLGLKTNGARPSAETKDLGPALKVVDGRENYQGVHVALLAMDAQGKPIGLRPASAGFTTGERFKLRVIATYDGLLSIDNINPAGQQRQLYPAQADHVVSLKAGQEILLPLDPQQTFRFSGATGQEQLVVTMRHAQAIGAAASTRPVNRNDVDIGTNLVQETLPGRFPVISQAISVRHAGS
jgi:hypothetical protein